MPYSQPFPLSPSLWAATAAAAPQTAPLAESIKTDALVIGGGYAGLSAALHLAEQGVNVVALEAREIGFGGSGRNGGQVNPGLKYDPDDLLKMFGPERGELLVQFGASTADLVFSLIEKHGMDVPRVRKGWIQGAFSADNLRTLESRARQWERYGAGGQLLDRAGAKALMGTDSYQGGWVDTRGGVIQPLSYVRGLAKAAIAAGARVHTDSPVASLSRQGAAWVASTTSGAQVTADRVLMCTNAYGGKLWPGLQESVIDACTYQVATQPLPPDILASIMPQGHYGSDARKLVLYFRVDHQGRLLMGGRGPFREPKGEDDWRLVESVLAKMFPQAKRQPIEYRWMGRVAITRDYLPHLHELAPGLLADIGCQGRGVGMQTAMGLAMARYAMSGDVKTLPVPLTQVKAFPFYGLRRLYVGAVVNWYRLTGGGL